MSTCRVEQAGEVGTPPRILLGQKLERGMIDRRRRRWRVDDDSVGGSAAGTVAEGGIEEGRMRRDVEGLF